MTDENEPSALEKVKRAISGLEFQCKIERERAEKLQAQIAKLKAANQHWEQLARDLAIRVGAAAGEDLKVLDNPFYQAERALLRLQDDAKKLQQRLQAYRDQMDVEVIP